VLLGTRDTAQEYSYPQGYAAGYYPPAAAATPWQDQIVLVTKRHIDRQADSPGR
jgi:hypothetical protein